MDLTKGLVGPEYLRSTRKRQLDLLGGSALLLTMMPVVNTGVLSAFLASESLRPIFTDLRQGQDGRYVLMHKMRTIPFETTRKEPWQQLGNRDHRANKVGNFLRVTNIDELLQLWAVVKGDMSLVGIRGVNNITLNNLRNADERLFEKWLACYHAGKPGQCGPGQDMPKDGPSASRETYVAAMKHDIEYVENASFDLDVQYLRETPAKLLHAAKSRKRGGSHYLPPTELDRLENLE